ncbi:MAG: hypothetical protein DRH12_07625 [Deltaproteobacteria bacterium]|nr:MAG: hypothetical protein DRH12_07625 [Deltaproteobacteria bacterium]RLB77315.1 MAG: hypothetical protein DRH15_11450 [Deltaproteobacteria bacterium]
MDDLDTIMQRLEHNEQIARKFFEVEVTVLSVLDFKGLFERLLTEIREKFTIPYVWITLIDEGDLKPLIPSLSESDVVRERLNIVPRNTLLGLIGTAKEPILVNRDLSPFYKLFPDHEKYLIRSLALTPLTLNEELVGTLNLGDSSPDRYVPGMDTTLLKRLAVKVSVCLSNVVAHEKVKLSSPRDEASGLLNKRAVEEILMREFQRAIRYENTLSIILFEVQLDNGSVADAGALEKAVSKVVGGLKELIRITDVLGTYEDGRYIIILPSTDKRKSGNMLERLSNHVSKTPIVVGGREFHLKLKSGIASTRDAGVIDPRSLVRRAMEMLLRQGREEWTTYE